MSLFIEDIHESASKVAMYFQQLSLAGVFSKVAGIVIGTFTQRPDKLDPIEPSIEQLIVDPLIKDLKLYYLILLKFVLEYLICLI